ncbi:DUF3883 domain-containing protein [Polynucleobacter sp. MG-6-Vaara-E2]|uniref:DUF3883 domain-containing protein n=1 Tax=Polynucleobacter sp. MG-6-Vaara-E2 TaxID=2576932 RepID=UPI001BFD2DC5|nr:DUF3883 domain-containing protein [Polynucleobacter sp. MG-6-Vaara-E2]QWD96258.1 DUF3883 domain-containing protein [Polynucleobacter sp. MG-6-Vaara-E2]
MSKTPYMIISEIRKEFGIDEAGTNNFRPGKDRVIDGYNNALRLLSTGLYNDQGHFVLEVIQNADDNQYDPKIIPKLEFHITPNSLRLVNNELGFREENVSALCTTGKSSKSKNRGFIGEKGIGFKSVFAVSDAPEIHSNGFHFRFNRLDPENLLGYIVPEWHEPSGEVGKHETTIILPAKTGYQFNNETFKAFDPRLLLFLSKLKEIKIEQSENKLIYLRLDRDEHTTLTSRTFLGGVSKEEKNNYLRVSKLIDVSGVSEESRVEISSSEIVLAFSLKENGEAKVTNDENVFAYLPIRNFGFKFIIQADFILSASRQDINTSSAWNTYLKDQIADIFSTEVLARFKASEPLTYSYLSFLSDFDRIVDPFFKDLPMAILEKLSNVESLPVQGGGWKKPRDIRIAPPEFQNLFPPQIAEKLFNFYYLDKRCKKEFEMLKILGVKSLTDEDLVDIFRAQQDWLDSQSVEWKSNFYAFLATRNISTLLMAGISSVNCIPLAGGGFAAPDDGDAYYPLGKNKKYGFEGELTFVDNNICELAISKCKEAYEFFAKINIKQPDSYTVIKSHILPLHSSEGRKSSENEALIGHLRYVKDNFEAFIASEAKNENIFAVNRATRVISNGMYIGSKSKDKQEWVFAKPDTLYISDEYDPSFSIERFLKSSIGKEVLVSASYIDETASNIFEEKKSWILFFKQIGIIDYPRVVDGTNPSPSEELQLLLDSENSEIRKATLEIIDKNWDYYQDKLETSLGSRRKSPTMVSSHFANALSGMFAPVNKRGNIPISQSYYRNQDIEDIFGDTPPYLTATIFNEELLDICGITYQVDSEACVKRLKQLKEAGGETGAQLKAIYRKLETLWDENTDFQFSYYGLIRIKKKGDVFWAKKDEVTWASNEQFLDSIYPPLEQTYRDFHGFFVGKLGVTEKLSISQKIVALTELDSIPDQQKKKEEAIRIYKQAGREYDDAIKNNLDIDDWLDFIRSNAVYLNQHSQMVSNSDNLYVNDFDEYGELFFDEERLSFLAIPSAEIPRLRNLFSEIPIDFVSENIEKRVLLDSRGVLDEYMTTKIKELTPFFARVFYHKNPRAFEEAMENHKFSILANVKVFKLKDLNVEIELSEIVKRSKIDAIYDSGSIYLQEDASPEEDLIAEEICNFFGIKSSDLIARLLLAKNDSELANILRVKGVPDLPSDVSKGLDGLILETPLDLNGEEGANVNNSDGDDADPIQVNTPNVPTEFKEDGSQSIASTTNSSLERGDFTGDEKFKIPSLFDKAEKFASPSRTSPNLSESSEPASSVNIGESHLTPQNSSSKRSEDNFKERASSGRLISYADSGKDSSEEAGELSAEVVASRDATARAAVKYFLEEHKAKWISFTEMPHNNPGFDVKATSFEGIEEYIEVKGQTNGWTEEGVILTPTELKKAIEAGDRYWLCVVEFAQDENRRRSYLIKNPFENTNQFRFDSGWKTIAQKDSLEILQPEIGLYVNIPDVGKVKIEDIKAYGQIYKIYFLDENQNKISKTFAPSKMILSKD